MSELIEEQATHEKAFSLDHLASEVAAVDDLTKPKELPAPDALPGDGEVKPEGQEDAPEVLMSATDEARELVELAALGVSAMWPVLGYREETKAEAANKLAPVLTKYNVRDTVLGKCRVEIEAGLFFGGLIIGSIQAVRAHKQAEQEQKEQPKDSWFARFFKWAK